MQWIDDDAGLREALTLWLACRRLGVDTEFLRRGTFYPEACLLQVASEDAVWLVDLQANLDLEPLAAVLENPNIEIIMHACAEDLEILRRLNLPMPACLFDTQVAAPFCGYGYGPGLQNLCDRLLGVPVDKSVTRTDWSQRPLSEKQLHYAAEDVRLLHPLRARLSAKLSELGRTAWFEEDMKAILVKSQHEESPQHAYRRLRAAWKLSPKEQHVLQALAGHRETRMREWDRPRKKVASDDDLMLLANRRPQGQKSLARLRSKLSEQVMTQAKDWLAVLKACEVEEIPADFQCIQAPLARESKAFVQQVKDVVESVAAGLAVEPPLLANRSQVEACVRWLWEAGEQPAFCQGWRGEQLTERFLALRSGQSEE